VIEIDSGMRRHLVHDGVALLSGLTFGLIVDSAVAAGLATLVFAVLFLVLDDRPSQQR
jgi:hypothetical protein